MKLIAKNSSISLGKLRNNKDLLNGSQFFKEMFVWVDSGKCEHLFSILQKIIRMKRLTCSNFCLSSC